MASDIRNDDEFHSDIGATRQMDDLDVGEIDKRQKEREILDWENEFIEKTEHENRMVEKMTAEGRNLFALSQ